MTGKLEGVLIAASLVALALLSALIALNVLGARAVERRQQQSRAAVACLDHGVTPSGARPEASPPEPVARHLRWACPGAEAPRALECWHVGNLRLAPGGRPLPLRSVLHLSPSEPSYRWSARVLVAPLCWLEVDDRLERGTGRTTVRLWGLIPLVTSAGAAVDQGNLVRYLSELLLSPSALNHPSLTWTRVGRLARATLVDRGMPVSLTFEGDDTGRLSRLRGHRVRTDARGGASIVGWTMEPRRYEAFAGCELPTSVTWTWELPDGDFTYGALQLTRVTPLQAS